MLKKNKRGIVETLLMYLIPIGVFLIILIFMTNFFKAAGPYAKDEACRSGLMIIDKVAKTVQTETVKPLPDSCRYNEEIIPYEDPDDVEREIIKLMDRCWWRMGEGKINPFAKNWLAGWTESKCLTCFIFKAPNLKKIIDKDKFLRDLMQIEAPNGQNYWMYFNGHLITEIKHAATGVKLDELYNEMKMSEDIKNDRYYSIVFVDLTSSTLSDWGKPIVKWMQKWGFGIGGLIGALLYEEEEEEEKVDLSKIHIIELNKAQECYDDSWFVETGELS